MFRRREHGIVDRVTLFSTPIFSFDDVGDAELDRELAGRLILESEGAAGIVRSNSGGWHSVPDLTQRPEACYQELMRRVVARVQAAIFDLAREQDVPVELRHRYAVQAWAMVMRHGDHTLVHDHAESHFSVVYYPAAGDADREMFPDSGKLCFVDPRRGGIVIPGLELFPSQFAIEPQTGLLIIFPGYLQHFVQPYRGGRPRVSISCNVRVEIDPTSAS
jgi:uncharacterized protein (TIGR02466 family)